MEKLFIAVSAVLLLCQEPSTAESVYEPLVNHLVDRAKSRAIPIHNQGDKVHVVIQVGIQSIERLDKDKNQVEMSLMVNELWQSGLSWAPEDFSGLQRVILPRSQMWTPNIRIANAATRPVSLSTQNVIILSNGFAALNDHYRVTVACANLSEDNGCGLSFDSFVYSNEKMVLETPDKAPFDLQEFFGMWRNKGARYQALDMKPEESTRSELGFVDSYDVITFKFRVKDKFAHFRRGPSELIFKWSR